MQKIYTGRKVLMGNTYNITNSPLVPSGDVGTQTPSNDSLVGSENTNFTFVKDTGSFRMSKEEVMNDARKVSESLPEDDLDVQISKEVIQDAVKFNQRSFVVKNA